MALTRSKRPAQTSVAPNAFLEISVDLPSVNANTTLDHQIAAPSAFKYNRPVLVNMVSAATALNAGLVASGLGRVVYNSGKKIEFRVRNITAAPIDNAAAIFHFVQL